MELNILYIDNAIAFIVIIVTLLVIWLSTLIFIVSIKKCPSDKIMVIYGKLGKNTDGTEKTFDCIHGGAKFVIPIIQAYQFLDLTPISFAVNLTKALTRQKILIDVNSRFTVGISTEPGIMQNAAETLLGIKTTEIEELAKDIIFGQLRLTISAMDIEEIDANRDKFLEAVCNNVESEIKKIGLRLINVNINDINDESGNVY